MITVYHPIRAMVSRELVTSVISTWSVSGVCYGQAVTQARKLGLFRAVTALPDAAART